MGETLSEYIHMVTGAIIFCFAIGSFLLFLKPLDALNKQQIEDMEVKASVTVDSSYGYDGNIYISGSSVFTDIISKDEDIPIWLDGTLISEDYLLNVRENNTTYVSDLMSKISMDGKYSVCYSYYSTNQIKNVQYVRR